MGGARDGFEFGLDLNPEFIKFFNKDEEVKVLISESVERIVLTRDGRYLGNLFIQENKVSNFVNFLKRFGKKETRLSRWFSLECYPYRIQFKTLLLGYFCFKVNCKRILAVEKEEFCSLATDTYRVLEKDPKELVDILKSTETKKQLKALLGVS